SCLPIDGQVALDVAAILRATDAIGDVVLPVASHPAIQQCFVVCGAQLGETAAVGQRHANAGGAIWIAERDGAAVESLHGVLRCRVWRARTAKPPRPEGPALASLGLVVRSESDRGGSARALSPYHDN